jgi:Bardet-Biedl syndrome 9 protein
VPSQLDAGGSSGAYGEDHYEDGYMCGAGFAGRGRSLTLRVFATYSGAGSIENVQLSINLPPPLTASATLVTIPSLQGGARTPAIVQFTVYAGSASLPPRNEAVILATYTTGMGEPRCSRTDVMLPLCLFCQVVPPVKNAAYKITLDTTRMPPMLTTLFEDLVSTSVLAHDTNQRAASNNVLSFQYFSGHDVTILVSKNAGRYRLQAGSFEALWLIADELCRRLTTYFRYEHVSSHSLGRLFLCYPPALALVAGW